MTHNINQILNEEVNNILLENLQLADKVYFKTGILNGDDKKYILSITKGDYTTKIISDLYYELKKYRALYNDNEKYQLLISAHNQIINYNKYFFPIKDFDINNKNNAVNIFLIKKRAKILDDIKKLPSIAIRNMRNEIREPRNDREFDDYQNSLNYFVAQFSLLGNRDVALRDRIYKKMFKSNIRIDDLISFADDKENLLGGKDFNKETILSIIEEHPYDLRIVFQNSNAIVVEVSSLEGIKEIGCNSLWCFTYGKENYSLWYKYSTNGIVYAIIDFREPSDSQDFIHVLISPLATKYTEDNEDESPLFNMANDNEYNPHWLLTSILGKVNFKKLFTFQ